MRFNKFFYFSLHQDPPSYDDETEGLIQSDGMKPSTSRGFREDEDSDKSEKEPGQDEPKEETELDKKKKLLISKLMMIPTLISSILVSLTLRLHRVSKSYQYVTRALTREKKTLKVRTARQRSNSKSCAICDGQ